MKRAVGRGLWAERGEQRAERGARRPSVLLGLLLLLSALSPLHSAHGQRTHLLIVSGLGGEPQYSEQFRTLALSLFDAARKRYAMADSDVVYLAEEGAKDPRIGGVSTKVNVEAALARFAKRSGAGDQGARPHRTWERRGGRLEDQPSRTGHVGARFHP